VKFSPKVDKAQIGRSLDRLDKTILGAEDIYSTDHLNLKRRGSLEAGILMQQ
jgi:hypothetical protein